jgi:hypothetical protein
MLHTVMVGSVGRGKRRTTVTLALMTVLTGVHTTVVNAQAVGAELSPGVSWEPHGPDTRAVGVRRLNAAEVRLARQRADAFYTAFKASPNFATPRDRAHLVVSYAAIESPWQQPRVSTPVLEQTVTAYWTVPRDVTRKPDGVLTPKLGGAHELLTFDTNRVPRAEQLRDRATAGDFGRGDETDGRAVYFAEPRLLGRVGGGVVFANMVVLTRDGSSPLEPAPIGALLDLEIERLQAAVAFAERASVERIEEAEASMSPARVSERRAKRAAAWQRETRDPAELAKRLDAAHRTDLADVERTRSDFAIPAQRDPRHRYWGPKLALDAANQLAAALGMRGRVLPACGRMEPGFSSSDGVRFLVLGSAPDCVPMVQVRSDLLDSAQPLETVQLLIVHFRDSSCGEIIGGAQPLPSSGRCAYAVPLLRDMDWAMVRRALGWP